MGIRVETCTCHRLLLNVDISRLSEELVGAFLVGTYRSLEKGAVDVGKRRLFVEP